MLTTLNSSLLAHPAPFTDLSQVKLERQYLMKQRRREEIMEYARCVYERIARDRIAYQTMRLYENMYTRCVTGKLTLFTLYLHYFAQVL